MKILKEELGGSLVKLIYTGLVSRTDISSTFLNTFIFKISKIFIYKYLKNNYIYNINLFFYFIFYKL